MPQTQLTLLATQTEVESLSDALMEAGALAVSVEDEDLGSSNEKPLYGEPGMEPTEHAWTRSRLIVLFENDEICDLALAELISADIFATGELTQRVLERTTVQDEDWVRITQAQFEPIIISPRLSIVPTWHEAPPTDITITLDPGVAFGTGSHPTTHLCLQWLCENEPKQKSLLDYGAGSGILAIAAAKLGAQPILAVDIDPAAVQASANNALLNRVSIITGLPSAAQQQRFDVVMANILSTPLKLLAPLLASYAKPNGQLVLSGILERQTEEMIEHYAAHAHLKLWRAHDGWVCLAGKITTPA
jgi:ribosomal protein L11 methyltransferase